MNTISSGRLDTLRIDSFNIESLIPEFLKDSNFHKVSGFSVGTDIQQIVFYSSFYQNIEQLFLR